MALLTDFYELTMLEAYVEEGLGDEAVFSLYVRRLPRQRNYLLACGLGEILHYLENLRFTRESIDYVRSLGRFSDGFLSWLETFRFEGDVHAVPEGTPVFANEPILEVVAPLPQAQLVETFLLNQIHFQTLVASKATRVLNAAGGRSVVDFGLRRVHGADAGIKAARAFYIAGVEATSNVLAGQIYGIPLSGTMAHSYIQAHDDELDAFRAFTRVHPSTVLLVDTYDTLDGVRKVVDLARELGPDFKVRAIRLDSGNLVELAFQARSILDEAGLGRVGIFASGGLDEKKISDIIKRKAPITGFGVGTNMSVSRDVPALDVSYKLTAYAGRDRLKLSAGKRILPGRKQIFRVEEGGHAVRDILAGCDEKQPGRPLLQLVMARGRRLEAGRVDIHSARERAARELSLLPGPIRSLAPAVPPYAVQVSPSLANRQRQLAAQVVEP